MVTGYGNAGGMNLGETGIGEERPLFVSTVGRGHVATARIGRKIENISVAAGRQDNRVTRDVVDLSGAQISSDDSLRLSVNDHDVEHFGLGKHLDGTVGDLAAERLVTAKQKLLAGLAAGVKRP